jgi:hypothetical protein
VAYAHGKKKISIKSVDPGASVKIVTAVHLSCILAGQIAFLVPPGENRANTWLIRAAGVPCPATERMGDGSSVPIEGPLVAVEGLDNKQSGGSRSIPIQDSLIVILGLPGSFSSRPSKTLLTNKNNANAAAAIANSFKIAISFWSKFVEDFNTQPAR